MSPREAKSAAEPALASGSGETDPIALFSQWYADAQKAEPNLAEAMALATVDAEGLPDCRMVLLKGFDHRGFTFFTNTSSAKGRELAANPRAALVFHWKSLGRQVRARGDVSPVAEEEGDAYFATRPRSAQIGAWASDQSQEMAGPMALERRVAAMGVKFGLGEVPRPPHWSGYRLAPRHLEFWREKPFRLHERLAFERCAGETWTRRRLFP
ncbi:MAG: pyridoxamine 5'-phosphate oxidase [Caulobacteraceae bacterium]